MLTDDLRLRGLFVVRKYWADDDLRRATPYEVVEAENIGLTAGIQALWQLFSAQATPVAFSAANARLCVGNGTTAAAVGQTDLQGATKTRKLVDAAPSISGSSITYVATFGATEGNHAWEEAGLANNATAGVLFDRVVQSFGVKANPAVWVLTGTLSIA